MTINLFNSLASRQYNFKNTILKFNLIFSFIYLFENKKRY